MATFHFELVSPERLLFSGEVTQVDVPGEAGDFGVLAGHAPYIATLKPGVLTVYRDAASKIERIVVRGGFAEAGPTVLPYWQNRQRPWTRSIPRPSSPDRWLQEPTHAEHLIRFASRSRRTLVRKLFSCNSRGCIFPSRFTPSSAENN